MAIWMELFFCMSHQLVLWLSYLSHVENLHIPGKISQSLLDELTSGEIAIELQKPTTYSAIYEDNPLILCRKQ